MELGEATLSDILRDRALNPDEALSLARALAAVLAYLHDEADLPGIQRLAHRDIKPANILLVPSPRGGERWKLSDLGTIRAHDDTSRATPAQIGTVEYAPPEYADGDSGPAWDIWSLGVVLCEALTNRLPFGQPGRVVGLEEWQRAIRSEAPRLPERLSPPLAAVLPRMLSKDPQQRPAAGELLAALSGTAAVQPPAAAAPAARPPAPMQAAAVPPAPPPSSPVSAASSPLDSLDTPAERQLRIAFQRALEDKVLSAYERTELNELRKRLDIRLERAAAIAREELARSAGDAPPLSTAPAASSPPLVQPASPRDTAASRRVQPDTSLTWTPSTEAPRAGGGRAEFIVDADPLRHADFRCISDAIAAAPSGSRIQVRTGLYQEHLVLDKPLEIVGYDAQSAVQVVSAQRHALIVNADGVLLKRLRLVAGQSGGGTTSDLAVSALVVSRGRVEAEDCSFECHSENCVAVFGGTSLGVFKRCEIKGGRSVGLSSTHDARVVAEHCTIIEAGLAGASCSNGGQLRLSGSRVLQCRENGVLVYVEGTGSLRECEVARNGAAGIALKNGGRAEIDRCRINYNSGPGVLAQTGCAASVKGCNLSHNQRPWQADRGSTLIREANVE